MDMNTDDDIKQAAQRMMEQRGATAFREAQVRSDFFAAHGEPKAARDWGRVAEAIAAMPAKAPVP
jgi:hypothetical protein